MCFSCTCSPNFFQHSVIGVEGGSWNKRSGECIEYSSQALYSDKGSKVPLSQSAGLFTNTRSTCLICIRFDSPSLW
jgi:hypothetical protein